MMALHINEEGNVMLSFRRTRKEFEDGSSIAGDEVKEKIFVVPSDEDFSKFTDAVAFVEATMALDTEKYHTCPLVVLIEELVKQGIQNYISLAKSKRK